MTRRIGAYILMGDPVWLASSLSRYYDFLDDLVLLVPDGGIGWTGRALPVEACREAVAAVDSRGIAREVHGRWVDPADPLGQDTAQRRAGLGALADCDWVLQIDNDEVLPDVAAFRDAIDLMDEGNYDALEWPLRPLFRSLGAGRFLQIVNANGSVHVDYPGALAVRPHVELTSCRRVGSAYVRAVIPGDSHSLQVSRPPEPGEIRLPIASTDSAIWHNSWGRSPASVWQKINSWGHADGWRSTLYYVRTWLPSRLLWRWQRNVHPFGQQIWPRLQPMTLDESLMHPHDRP